MADVNAIFGTLLALGIAFPGMMVALRLMCPGLVDRTQACVMSSPWKSIARHGVPAGKLGLQGSGSPR